MSSFLALRRVRYFSSATTAAAATINSTTSTDAAESAITISKAKSKLRTEYDPDKALEIYATVSEHYTSPLSSRYAQDLTVKRLAKARRYKDIEKLIESHKNDPKVKQEPYLTTLIRSYGLAGMFNHALNTYNQMDELGTPRTAVSFNGLLSACNYSKLFGKVPQLFVEMSEKYNLRPNQFSYGILIKSYCEIGSPELGIEKMREMEEKGIEVTAVVFTTILHSLYKRGKVEEAEKIWDEMVRKGCELDVGVYNVRIMHVHNDKPESVKKLITEMTDAGIKPDTISYNYLMNCYCMNDMMAEAKKVYEGLEGNCCRPNAATFRTFIAHLCNKEMFEYGYKVFKKSVEVNKIPDFGTLKPLVEGLVKKLNKKDAKGLIRTLRKKFPQKILKAWDQVEVELGLISIESARNDIKAPRT
ncbi:Pentatricopeptide repeat-containing protein, mitochondrial [Heracleum sosnowskyi]|uniref:Pentatricopeptide repeat-containing protein, mitochondrial n=1 Tax=Heracleum sosnowskyi TaxID=360622 RepID=A0AAD8H0K7_9APIA|nr:Pentatricopeptide repeat-containing protein, mitochondrial [Heracleum sosnowskyi]